MPSFGPESSVAAIAAPAPNVALPAPAARVVQETNVPAGRRLVIRARSVRQATGLHLALQSSGEITDVRVDGRETGLPSSHEIHLAYTAIPVSGVELALTVHGSGPVRLTAIDAMHGLPAQLAPTARPPAFMETPSYELRDPTLVTKSFEF
jgi:hypothetical protein